MTPTHDRYTIERVLPARPADVFAAWSDPALKRRWFVDSDGPSWSEADYTLDFREGGTEVGRFVAADGPAPGVHENRTTFLQIVPEARIVFAYTMAHEGRVHSASLVTVTLAGAEGGTRLTFTEQMAVLGPSDGPEGRRAGWTHLLSALATSLREGAPA